MEDKISINRAKNKKINMEGKRKYTKIHIAYPPSTISSRHNRMRSKFSSASFLSTLPLEWGKKKVYKRVNKWIMTTIELQKEGKQEQQLWET